MGRVAQSAYTKLLVSALSLYASTAHAAMQRVDLTQDAASGKNLSDVAENAGGLLDSGVSLVMALAAFVGLVITVMSAYTIWKAGKDEREKPTSAIIGFFVGGAMLAIPAIMWLSRNSLFGN